MYRHCLGAALLALGTAAACAAEPVCWRFDEGDPGWRARSAGVSVARVPDPDGAGGVLLVGGRQEDGWNYALSESRPMTAGKLYRLGARLRVRRLGPGTPPPCLKCEFVHEERERTIGRVTTAVYDPGRMGQWQSLECEFRAPAGTVAFWVALEKGTSQPAEIEAMLDEVTVEEIPALSVLEKYRLAPLPAPLAAVRGVHPRLYLTGVRAAALREAVRGTHAHLWEGLRARADAAAQRRAPAYIEQDGHSGEEQLWQREVGNTIPTLALAWVLSGERPYLDATREWALASCSYPTWGLGRIDGMDLAAGHQLFGLALAYDWCRDALDQETLAAIRATLVRRTSALFEAAAGGGVWWHRSYLQNHLWVNICGMAAAGLALFDEVEGADRWVGLPLEKFRTTMGALGPDGASHEGAGYWQYGVEYMLKFMDLAADLLGEDLFDNAWWRNTASYAHYLTIPRSAWGRSGCLIDVADCPRGNWYGPDHLLRRLARQYRDGHAQWLADEITAARIEAPSAPWLNLLWYDATVPPQPPSGLAPLRHFADMGIVVARSDWSGGESLVAFKCGPFIGHEAVRRFSYDPGGGHVHPDANHFVIFGGGEWLLRDDGYRAKWTGQHNTLLVDGKGQLGEGQQWFDGSRALRAGARPRVLRADAGAALDVITGDAAAAYPDSLGLTRFVRHLLYLKPDVLLVLDDIAADGERSLELRFHPESSDVAAAGNAAFLVRGRGTRLRAASLTPEGVSCRAGDLPAAGRGEGVSAPMTAIVFATRRAAWRHAAAFSWCAGDSDPAGVGLDAAGDRWTFRLGDRAVQFDWRTGQAATTP